MSPLTRVFVALLVVLSLLLTAATVTFVATVDDYRLASTNADQALQNATARSGADLTAAQEQAAALQGQIDVANGQITQLRTLVNAANQQVATAQGGAAATSGNLAVAQANVSQLSSALQTAEATTNQLQTQVAALRGTSDERLEQLADLNRRITELQNLYDVAERERRFNAEQLVDLRRQADRLGAALRDAGGNPDNVAGAGTRGGAPRIEGVVRATRVIAGIPYATISVGSEDAVRQGMQFNVISGDGRYLGKIEVQTVDPNEAIARIVGGPRQQDIAEGAVVRTQS